MTRSSAAETTPEPPKRSAKPVAVKPAAAVAAEWIPLDSISVWADNPRRNAEAIPRVRASIVRFGWGRTLVVRAANRELIVGHTATAAARDLARLWAESDEQERGRWHEEAVRTATQGLVPVRLKECSEDDAHMLALADNRLGEYAEWDEEKLADLLKGALEREPTDVEVSGFLQAELDRLFGNGETDNGPGGVAGSLTQDYGEPPFTVFDTRSGRWQSRRALWLALGIRSEEGRGQNLLQLSAACELQRRDSGNKIRTYKSKMLDGAGRRKKQTPSNAMLNGSKAKAEDGSHMAYSCGAMDGTSVFDPVLCELLYSWFSPKGGLVLDPFAGGSVRGVVAAALGRSYLGLELREEQVVSNRAQWKDIAAKLRDPSAPEWRNGDSRKLLADIEPESADFAFSCPPYMDLEVYSNNPADISSMKPEDFAAAYARIIRELVARLKPNRFACFVVSEVREKLGIGAYRSFPAMTVAAFEAAGARYYNEGVLINSAGSLPIRIRKQFESGRKLGRCHQNVLLFVKGDPQKAAKACGKVTHVEWAVEAPTETVAGRSTPPAGVKEWTGDTEPGQALNA